MDILNRLNGRPMYMICGGIVIFVALICLVFLVRAYRAGKAIGMDVTKMRRVITSSATFAVLPSVGILLGVIALAGSMGVPWPWLRLSVIGALHYETQVAQAAAEQVGVSALSANEMTAEGFATIALLMSICIMWGMVLSIFFNRRYLQKINRKTQSDQGGAKKPGFGDLAMSAMFIGLVSAYLGSYLGNFISGKGRFTFAGDWISIAVALVSGVVMAIFIWLAEEKQKTWVENFSIAGSMIIGMAAAVVLGFF